ncbi:MAG: type II toxin-antitoxin system RelE/ParE family toxin [Deltaproteobacteria bacterium]|nr:MAG: type II toxin-antitoxin system RelE/ParE family toxin [Deltaproteobacteria bacterium]
MSGNTEKLRPVVFTGSSLNDLRAFPRPARREAGFQITNVQSGTNPDDWKPMRNIGPGAMEIRIHEGGEFRVVYVAKFEEAVYVLHAFQKKTQKTRNRDIALARKRYREMSEARRK